MCNKRFVESTDGADNSASSDATGSQEAAGGAPASRSPHRPFCSARCKLADLDNWMNGRYRISRPMSEQDLDESLIN